MLDIKITAYTVLGFATANCSIDFVWSQRQQGANSYGQLGLGHTDDKITPQKMPNLNFKPKWIGGGGGHSVFLDVYVAETGELYACGWNNNGQLGLEHQDNVTRLQKLSLPIRMQKVACGWNHTIALSVEGKLYSWGSNAFGQLGHSPCSRGSIINTPTLIEDISDREFIDTCAGLRHTHAVEACGQTWSWGACKKGQLGIGERMDIVEKPVLISTLRGIRVKKVVAGSYHSACLTECGEVFCWGSNRYGQCTLADKTESLIPVKISSESCVNKCFIDIHSGWSHVVAVVEGGIVYSWGRCDYGQLGYTELSDGDSKRYQQEPACVPNLHDLRQIACGSEHNIVISGL
ncbi:uncharacterized protein TRIADDRAFT_52018 [Trichoplax adhaerens]|uniref:RCC1-like domain-containing protein n=1 Tax=Trichoplax adhaerens TaxID=10228 RepID=B3RLI9_TRIAD|nr:hypothetical protein TRIADDRAFT_52018 [Trichoplax adhaerens]EDV28782.1 hypothetical protein TRIADDRAFT_52018 [Trichoplax adhaerens]|eukprot:XP_002107984.1 hypothetical protein TRIADDRAFT_52018 [Trichoplax adhaerens]